MNFWYFNFIFWTIFYYKYQYAAFLDEKSNSIRQTLRLANSGSDLRQYMEINLMNKSIEESAELAYKNCRQQMQWERWDCPKLDFFKDSEYTNRETAFKQSISAAAIAFKIMRECYEGKFYDCRCNEKSSVCTKCMQPKNWKRIMRKSRKTIKFILNPDYKRGKNYHTEISFHNHIVGLNVVKDLIKTHCNCKSWAGKCIFQPLEEKMISFDEVARTLKKRWQYAKRLDYNGANLSKYIRSGYYKNSLIYNSESPNYCATNITDRIQGTNGRLCFRSNEEEIFNVEEKQKKCQTLCYSCGHTVNRKLTTNLKRCNCRMNGCCDVICESCKINTINYSCVSKDVVPINNI